jgi:hypothetical protein
MSRMLQIMHHIALCTSCIAYFNLDHLYAYLGTSHGAGTRDLRGASPRVFGGPQASSCEDVNIVVIKVSPGASHPILDFYFN